jgi:hypothetical protein
MSQESALKKSFYAGLSAGQSVAEARRQAKSAMIHSERPARRQPHFWVPFIVSALFDCRLYFAGQEGESASLCRSSGRPISG